MVSSHDRPRTRHRITGTGWDKKSAVSSLSALTPPPPPIIIARAPQTNRLLYALLLPDRTYCCNTNLLWLSRVGQAKLLQHSSSLSLDLDHPQQQQELLRAAATSSHPCRQQTPQKQRRQQQRLEASSRGLGTLLWTSPLRGLRLPARASSLTR